MIPIIILALAIVDSPPMPPSTLGYPITSPKHTELIGSLGLPMAKVVVKPLVVPQGFTITNLSLNGGNVSLQWQQGVPPFQVQAENNLGGSWLNVTAPTTDQSRVFSIKTFPPGANQFFRVQGSVLMTLSAKTTNNVVTLNWNEPESTSGTFGPFNLFVRTNAPSKGSDWGPPIQVLPSTARTTTATITNDSWFTVTQNFTNTMASRVEIDWNTVTATLNVVSPGDVNWVNTLSFKTGMTNTGSVQLYGVAVDSSDNIYVVGGLQGNGDLGSGLQSTAIGNTDGFISKFNSAGVWQWTQKFGTSQAVSRFNGVVIDASGNIIVVGTITGSIDLGSGVVLTSNGGYDAVVIQFSPAGVRGWYRQIGGTNGETGNAIAFDPNAVPTSGNIYVAISLSSQNVDYGSGFTLSSNGSYDVSVAKLKSTDGTTVWAISHGDPDEDDPMSIAVDKFGDVYVGGWFYTSTTLGGPQMISAGQYDGFVVKYSGTDGHFLWQRPFSSANADRVHGVACDPVTGNVVVAGSTFGCDMGSGTVSGGGLFIVGYKPDGTWLWQFVTGGSFPGQSIADEVIGVAIDNSGTMVVTGDASSAIYFGPPSPAIGGPTASYYAVGLTISGNAKPVWKWTNRSQNGQGNGQAVALGTFVNLVGVFQLITDVGPAGTYPVTCPQATPLESFLVQYNK